MVRVLGALVAFLGLIVLVSWTGVEAITVYPIDRAEILAGARFDLKIEFDRVIPASQARVTINGEGHAAVLG
jgi:alkaline phosphatase